jgi:hypothetical protein
MLSRHARDASSSESAQNEDVGMAMSLRLIRAERSHDHGQVGVNVSPGTVNVACNVIRGMVGSRYLTGDVQGKHPWRAEKALHGPSCVLGIVGIRRMQQPRVEEPGGTPRTGQGHRA